MPGNGRDALSGLYLDLERFPFKFLVHTRRFWSFGPPKSLTLLLLTAHKLHILLHKIAIARNCCIAEKVNSNTTSTSPF